jgi:hypothetical protein
MHRGKVTRDREGTLTDGKKTIRCGDLVRVRDGRIGDVVFTRVYLNVSRPGKYDSPIRKTYSPQAMVHFEGWPPYGEMIPFRFLRQLFPDKGLGS